MSDNVASINPALLESLNQSNELYTIKTIDPDELFLVNDEGSGGQIYAESPNASICYKIQRPPLPDAPADIRANVFANGLREIANCVEYSGSGITPEYHGTVITPDGRLGHAMEFFPKMRLLNHMPDEELLKWEQRVREFERYMVSRKMGVLGEFELAAVSEGNIDIDVFQPETCRLVLLDLTSLHHISSLGDTLEEAIKRHHDSFDIYMYQKMDRARAT